MTPEWVAFWLGFASGFMSGAGLVLLVGWLVRRSEARWVAWVRGDQRRRRR